MTPEAERRMRAALRRLDCGAAPANVEQVLVGAAAVKRRNRRLARLAVAAAGLVVLWLGVPQRAVPPAPTQVAMEERAPVREPAREAVQTVREEETAPVVPVRRRVRARRPAAPVIRQAAGSSRYPELDGFVPVGAWQALEPMERGSIVRVQVPPGMLPGWSLPVSAERWNEPVPAEVMLGEDGTLRAVRFVNAKQF